jgi:hypothetical protein
MKTIALTLFAAALGLAQGTPPSTVPATAQTPKYPARTASPAQKPAAQNSKGSPTKPSPDQKAKAQSQTQSIPAGAAQVEPNLYRYTDSDGKTWNYRQTPFGISRWEEKPASAQPTSQPNSQATPEAKPAKSDPVAFTDLGDSYRFEKKTPFGTSTWVHKKTELNAEEKALIAGPNSGESQVAEKSKEGK